MNELRLCYVDEPWAYFTTQSVTEQWGDDWNDAPYEHNAGRPYESRDPEKPWRIVRVAFEADLESPRSYHLNSRYSVEQINRGEVAWLVSPSYVKEDYRVVMMAGTTLADFKQMVHRAGGSVFEEATRA